MSTANTIKVVARFRPQNRIEVAAGSEQIVNFTTDDSCTIESREGSGAFTFDRIFPTNTPQQNVFDYSIRSTVDDVLAGYNGTVFAYGQMLFGSPDPMIIALALVVTTPPVRSARPFCDCVFGAASSN